MTHEEGLYAVFAFKLLILTGCRLNEIQTLKWDYIKPDSIHLPDSKTGTKKVYIGDEVRALLSGIPKCKDNAFVIAGKNKGAHLTDLERPWRRIRARLELDDVRIHDLRHSYASFALGNGVQLHEIKKLLGHKHIQTTERYAHLAEKYAHDAANRASGAIVNLTQPC